MAATKPVQNLCIYRVKQENKDAFHDLLRKHWPTLRRVGLATDRPPQFMISRDQKQNWAFLEIFEWRDEQGPKTAHETPEVMQIWEPMGALAVEMEFLDVKPLEV